MESKYSEVVDLLMTDGDAVKNAVNKITGYYNLKHTLRYNQTRVGSEQTESVAEHIYAMLILCDYFLPLHPEFCDKEKEIKNLITWHDMAEAFVGDMTSNTKTDKHKAAEILAEKSIVSDASEHMRERLQKVFDSFNQLTSKEAQFVKGLDRIEPIFHLLFLSRREGFKPFKLGWSADKYKEYRKPYVSLFPLLQRFDEVISLELDLLEYFPKQ
jgi:5'-deoxynucleotidase YfbR-like HD superfamily hydrolase